MKKIIAATVAFLMMLTTAGCSGSVTKKSVSVQPSAAQTEVAEKTPGLGKEEAAPVQEGLGGEEAAQTESIKVKSYKNLTKKATGLKADNQTTFVGLGYNVLESTYINAEGFTNGRHILKESEVQKRLKIKGAPSQNSHTIMGQTMKSYCEDLSAKLQLKSSYPLFSGSITSEFDKSQANKSKVYFIKSMSGYPKNSEYIDITNDLKDILDDTFAGDLNGDMSPEDLFSAYGTHLVVEALMGARCTYNYTYSSTETQTTTQVKAKVDATYRFISGSASIDDKTIATEFLSNTSFESALSGGKDIDATTLDNLIKNFPTWVESLATTTPTIYGISNMNSLIPIWELTTNAARKKDLQDYYNSRGGDIQKLIDSMSVIPDPTPPPQTYIQSIVITSNRNKTIAQKVYAGYTLVDNDLNKGAGGDFIYFSYNTTNDLTRALKDVRITFGKKETLPGSYKKDLHDLNAGAGGDFIYLWTSTNASNGKPIKVIDVFYGKNADIPTGYTEVDYNKTGKAADLNHNAGGDYIYLGIKR